MIVLKFGGTSVGTIESLTNVKKIVEGLTEEAIIVVSALGGLTDKLIATAQKAASGDATYKEELPGIAKRHYDIIDALVVPEKGDDVRTAVETLLGELFRLYDGLALIADLPTKTLDAIVSFGERMSSVIVAGIIAGAKHHDSPSFIKTEKWFDKNIARTELTDQLIREEFSGNKQWPAVIGGFISSDYQSGEITNLGRGGSDYTAALVAAALGARTLEIWTDVDGFMTADPRIIPSARLIPEMTFVESMELCSFGAKVIYPPTIYPVFHKNIPIKIRNTFRPASACTTITDHSPADGGAVTGISSLKDTALLIMRGNFCSNVAGINSRSFNALARRGISVFLVDQKRKADSFCFALSRKDLKVAVELMKEEFAPELASGLLEKVDIREGLATVAVVGEHLSKIEGIDTRILNALIGGNIIPYASSTSNSKTTATFVIEEDQSANAIRLIHSLFFPETVEE
ncbi:MAG: aspartate kinase [Clostridium sp.]|nr:aspartate kinase [Prevotella sp.]MCM1428686.1 aspartate kinase [Clostridium sp.]MCM1475061.1 aspartate kinase [Muribaculaceae bacterium]